MTKKIKIKVVARVDEVSSEKQRKFMCAMTSDDADRPDGLSKSEAEEMCKDTGHSKNEGVEGETQPDTNNVSKVMAVTMDNLVLILKRTDTGEWDIPGGHGHEGESVESTAERETYEETGLKIHDIDALRTQEVTFNGRVEQITYLSAHLGSTAMVLDDKITLDTNENNEFLFIKPMQIDGLMNNATQNLKNMANDIKSLPIEEQTEPFQRKMAAGYSKKKEKMIGLGGNKFKSAPFDKNPSFKRAKSAPPGFGAMGEGILREKMSSILSEIEFDLSKLAVQDHLNIDFWENNKLDLKIRQKLLDIAEDFIEGSLIEGRVEDITFTGSLASYNYHLGSDIDLHLLVDFDKDDELVQKLMNLLRMQWNENHDIRINGHEVEIYVQDANEPHYAAGVYSISDDKWLVEPSKHTTELNYDAIIDKAQGLSDEIDSIEDDFVHGEYEKAEKSAERLREKMKKMRSAGLEADGIYSIENLAFKLLRNSGQIAKLMNLSNDSYDSSMSMTQKDTIKVKIVSSNDVDGDK